MQREPCLHCLIVVRRIERAGVPRRAECPQRAIDLVRQTQLLPRHNSARLGDRDQGTGAFSQGRMRGEKRLDRLCTGCPEPLDFGPPPAATWNAHSQVGQCADAMGVQRPGSAWREPQSDLVGDLRLRCGQRTQCLDRTLDRAGAAVSLGGCMLERGGQIGPVAAVGKGNQLPANIADESARRFTSCTLPGQVARDGCPGGQARIPPSQRGERVVIGKALILRPLGLTRFHGFNLRI